MLDRLLTRWNVALGVAFMVGLFIIGVSLASSHSFYDTVCCNTMDCYPVDDAAIIDEPGGYRVVLTGEILAHDDPKVKFSPDGHWHRCSHMGAKEAKTICIYVPSRGS